MTQKKIVPPNPARLIEGLRDTGYDFNTALADIVDNSVDAGAMRIDIQIKMDGDGDVMVTVSDNGCGMNETTLLENGIHCILQEAFSDHPGRSRLSAFTSNLGY